MYVKTPTAIRCTHTDTSRRWSSTDLRQSLLGIPNRSNPMFHPQQPANTWIIKSLRHPIRQPSLTLVKATKEEEEDSIHSPHSEPTQLEKNGSSTILGAVSLIIGTTIGSGIIALPQKTYTAGFIPSGVSMVLCWAFLLIEAMLLAEVNVFLRLNRMKKKNGDNGSDGVYVRKVATTAAKEDVISFKSMAQETLGDWGAKVATLTYVFLAYTSMVAYASKSGDLLSHFFSSIPSPILAALFTTLVASIIFLGENNAAYQVNQWLTAFMIGLLVVIEVSALSSQGGGSGTGWLMLTAVNDWTRIPNTIPVIIFSLVYHDIVPVICYYLDDDMDRIRTSLIIGSLVPLLFLLVWDAITLGPVDDHLLSTTSMVETFSLLAIGTSLIGTLLGFSLFFQEQMKHKIDEKKKLNLSSIGIAVIPSLLLSAALPDAFLVATDIAGGYCMTILYGILPPAMAWSLLQFDNGKDDDDDDALFFNHNPAALLGIGLFASALVLDQLLQHL